MRIAACLLAVLVTPVALASPIVVSHSGFLLNAADAPVDATLNLTIKVFAQATPFVGETPVWESAACSVDVVLGYYATELGGSCNGTPALDSTHLPAGSSRWLEIAVAGVPLTPRTSIAPVAASADALALGGLGRSGFWEKTQDLVGATYGASTLGAAISAKAGLAGGNTFNGTQVFQGNVGIGSASPGTALDVAGTVRATTFSGSGSGLTSVTASDLSSGLFGTLDTRYPVLTGGRIAEGALPTSVVKADAGGVVGLSNVVVGGSTVTCGAVGSAGAMRYNATSKVLELCDGASWGSVSNRSPLIGWARRRAMTVTNPGALGDTQHRFTLDTAALVASGRMRSDCADVRVTGADGVTLLPFFIDRCNTSATTIWFRTTSLAAGSALAYVYYDNLTAPALSSGSGTFAADYAGLIGAWTFDEGTGTFADLAANGFSYTTTMSGAGYTAAGWQYPGLLVNSNATTAVPSPSISPGTGFTVAAWGYPTSWDTNHNTLVGQGNGFLLAINTSGVLANHIYAGGNWTNDGTATPSIPLNGWTHLGLTYNGSLIRSYVNGVAIGAGQAKTGAMGTLSNIGIGYRPIEGGPQYWHGRIDEVRIFNRALSNAEMSDVGTKCTVVSTSAPGHHFVRSCSALDFTPGLAVEEHF